MAHFAKLDENNIVDFVVVGRDEDNGKAAQAVNLALNLAVSQFNANSAMGKYGAVA